MSGFLDLCHYVLLLCWCVLDLGSNTFEGIYTVYINMCVCVCVGHCQSISVHIL